MTPPTMTPAQSGGEGKPYACKCGGTVFGVNRGCSGSWYQSLRFASKGYEVLDGCSNVRLAPIPKTMICEKCMKRQKNPYFDQSLPLRSEP